MKTLQHLDGNKKVIFSLGGIVIICLLGWLVYKNFSLDKINSQASVIAALADSSEDEEYSTTTAGTTESSSDESSDSNPRVSDFVTNDGVKDLLSPTPTSTPATSTISGGSYSSGGGGGSTTLPNPVDPTPDTPDVTAPAVSILNPAEDSTVLLSIIVRATSSDPVVAGSITSGVRALQFYIDSVATSTELLASNFPDAFELSLDTQLLANGAHSVSAIGIDNMGNRGATTTVTFTVANVITPQPPTFTFTKGGITLTFDDANMSQSTNVAPMLKAANQKATLFAPTGLIGTDGYMTWDNIAAMIQDGWEIGGHTVTHAELPTLTLAQAAEEITKSKEDLENHGILDSNFATPFGAYDVPVLAEVAKNFNSHRTFNHIALNEWPFNKYLLHVHQVTNNTSVANIEALINQALSNDQWLILVFHEVGIDTAADDTYTWTSENFETLLSLINSKGIKTKTVAEMLDIGTNLVSNLDFESGMDAWTTDNPAQVQIDTNSNGVYPYPKTSVKMMGGVDGAHLFSSQISVDSLKTYGIRFFINAKDLLAGELGFYADEYDENGNWISGKWLGHTGNMFAIDESYEYKAISAGIKKVSLQVYLTPGSVGNAYIDGTEMFEL